MDEGEQLTVGLGVYAAAFTVALTTAHEEERLGALRLMREIGGEALGPVRELRARDRGRRAQHSKPVGNNVSLKALIREVLEDRLGDADPS